MLKLRSDLVFRDENPLVSVCIPLFNHSGNLNTVLSGILDNMTLPFEILLLDDASTDRTCKVAMDILANLSSSILTPNLTRIRFWSSSIPLFETKADNFLFRESMGPLILEVQADILINDLGFDKRITEFFSQDSQLFAISGRGGHSLALANRDWNETLGSSVAVGKNLPWFILRRLGARLLSPFGVLQSPSRGFGRSTPNLQVDDGEKVGRIGQDFFTPPNYSEDEKKTIKPVETVIRGPLAIRKSSLDALGYLNDKRFFLGFDDHDLCARAQNVGLRVGYAAIECYSPPYDGATRRTRPWKHEIYLWLNLIVRRKCIGKVLGS